MGEIQKTAEYQRLQQDASSPIWKKWGTYVADRAWGTVREDYSADGNAWAFFPHEHSRFRTYRWSEDGIAAFCDYYQVLIFSFAFWNGKDPYLKERFFGLATSEGNHGEDVKEYYYYLDATPSFSYMKFLYKYPQQAFPYQDLYEINKRREQNDLEYELIDTGIFDQDKYFDIFIEYAKSDPDDICIRLEALNRSDNPASLYVIPQLWFRNQWSWYSPKLPEPMITLEDNKDFFTFIADDMSMQSPKQILYDYHLGKRFLYAPKVGLAMFTNNETNREKLWGGANESLFVKDAFHRKIIERENSTHPENKGTKGAIAYFWENIAAKGSQKLELRFTNKRIHNPFADIDTIFTQRKKEADSFYTYFHPSRATDEEKKIQREAVAGLIWSRQFYHYDVHSWFIGDSTKNPPPLCRKDIRNNHWRHLHSLCIFSMPDKWEYPWFAAWDLSFHCVSIALVDPKYAKEQLWLLLLDRFQHPNGQIPAYEWEFSDVNPPVQGWASLKIFEIEKKYFQEEDYNFLEKCFHKLLLNFVWWVNRVDISGKNVFEGGFLGLDNISIMDRSERNKNNMRLDETDASGWMAMFCLNLMKIALVLSNKNSNYEQLATKFFEHFIYIAAALRKGYWRDYDMWDETDGFFYSVINYLDGRREHMKVRSLVGIVPFFALEILSEKELQSYPQFYHNFTWFIENRGYLVDKCVHKLSRKDGTKYLCSLMHPDELGRFLRYLWDPNEFRSEFGLRSLSKFHESHPYNHQGKMIYYEPGESFERIKGGNSNWRGPIWFPANYFVIQSLDRLATVLEEQIKISVNNEPAVSPGEMSKEFKRRLLKLFLPDASGSRPIYGLSEKFQKDPQFNQYTLFFEHYHGDTGRGLGASHQTGWSALILNLIQELRS